MATYIFDIDMGRPPAVPRNRRSDDRDRPTSEFHSSNFIFYDYDHPLLLYSIRQPGGKGYFTSPRETTGTASIKDLFLTQPAQFQPRTDWSHWPHSGPPESRPVLSIRDEQDIVTLKLSLSKAVPSPAFRDGAVVGDVTWLDHRVRLWNIIKSIEVKQPFGKMDPISLLCLIRSGMESQVGIMLEPLFLQSLAIDTTRNPMPGEIGFNPNYLGGADMVANPLATTDTIFGYDSSYSWKREMFNRRFFIGFVTFESFESRSSDKCRIWSSIIWDRVRAHLYVYNAFSFNNPMREEVVIRIGLAFRQVLAKNGLPFNFDVFAPPVMQLGMGEHWASGVVASNLLLINLRGLVGVKFEGLVACQSGRTLVVDNRKLTPDAGFDLRHRDWDTEPWKFPEGRVPVELNKACNVLSVIIMDEFGIKDLLFDQGRTAPDRVSLTDRSPDMTYLPQSCSMLRSNTGEVYTNLGGPQYVVFDSRKVYPSRAMRFVHPPITSPARISPSLPHTRSNVNFPYTLIPLPMRTMWLYMKQGWMPIRDELVKIPRDIRRVITLHANRYPYSLSPSIVVALRCYILKCGISDLRLRLLRNGNTPVENQLLLDALSLLNLRLQRAENALADDRLVLDILSRLTL
ncbi:hypothetical protein B0J13DRAFT_638823 [Dactylonectria estremocensis]|uniref:Uncharacterized protein n=1 Tax=Dactylonectria estremocensis TaxID=1079267 RepID=A0A9P9IZN4_9HYPO|nr:hypothetical protein B0J13DRAFT_638823 [Dactylonectria estremocensis]